MTDTYELEKLIRMNGFTKKEVAQRLGLSEQGFLLKLNNRSEFKASEIDAICRMLELENNDLFFCTQSELNSRYSQTS